MKSQFMIVLYWESLENLMEIVLEVKRTGSNMRKSIAEKGGWQVTSMSRLMIFGSICNAFADTHALCGIVIPHFVIIQDGFLLKDQISLVRSCTRSLG